jgi:hypothetical protein
MYFKPLAVVTAFDSSMGTLVGAALAEAGVALGAAVGACSAAVGSCVAASVGGRTVGVVGAQAARPAASNRTTAIPLIPIDFFTDIPSCEN